MWYRNRNKRESPENALALKKKKNPSRKPDTAGSETGIFALRAAAASVPDRLNLCHGRKPDRKQAKDGSPVCANRTGHSPFHAQAAVAVSAPFGIVRLAQNSFRGEIALKPVFPGLPALFPETGRALYPVSGPKAPVPEKEPENTCAGTPACQRKNGFAGKREMAIAIFGNGFTLCGCPSPKVLHARVFRFLWMAEKQGENGAYPLQAGCRPAGESGIQSHRKQSVEKPFCPPANKIRRPSSRAVAGDERPLRQFRFPSAASRPPSFQAALPDGRMALFIPRKTPANRYRKPIPRASGKKNGRKPAKTPENRHEPTFPERKKKQGHPKSGADRQAGNPLFPKRKLSKQSGKTAGQPYCRGRENARFRADCQNGFPKPLAVSSRLTGFPPKPS